MEQRRPRLTAADLFRGSQSSSLGTTGHPAMDKLSSSTVPWNSVAGDFTLHSTVEEGPVGSSPSQIWRNAMLAGGAAGTAVDMALFPLDTLKTRLQSAEGFFASGGFRGVYRGLLATVAGSAPNAALFFVAYESIKTFAPRMQEALPGAQHPEMQLAGIHMFASTVGESAACLIRVPTDNVKQKLQAGHFHRTRDAVQSIMARAGPAGFFDGYLSTLCREIPFVLIQFPLYELFKRRLAAWEGRELQTMEAAICGGASGALGAILTTPFDVVKTRIMLGCDRQGVRYTTVWDTMQRVYAEGGVRSLWAGTIPRVVWLTLGGVVFLGSYEAVKSALYRRDAQTAAEESQL